MPKLTRIEEVKKILNNRLVYRTLVKKTYQDEDIEELAKEICQLFPQPLDDKELREKIVNTLFALCTEPKFTYAAWRCSKSESPDIVGLIDMPQFQMAVNKALALLQPKVKQLRQESEARREIIRRLTAKCEQLQGKIQTTNVYYLREIQSNKVECESKIEEAKREERERIVKLLGYIDYPTVSDFSQDPSDKNSYVYGYHDGQKKTRDAIRQALKGEE